MSRPTVRPYVGIFVGIAAVSFAAIFIRLADAPSLVIASYRLGLASLILAPVARLQAGQELRSLTSRDLRLAVVSGLFLVFHFALWIESLSYTSVASSVVFVATMPLFVGLASPLLLSERLGSRMLTGMLIAVAGGMTVGFGDMGSGWRELMGDLLAVGGAMRYFLFDLDNTLYPRDSGVMQRIGQRITEYLIQRMGMSLDEAEELRRTYWPRYGTTLRGLQVNHNIDPDDYLDFVHDFAVEGYLGPDEVLDQVLGQIAAVKTIFTNATREHTQRVLGVLGIAQHFSRVFDIRSQEYINKPDRRAYHRVLRALQAQPEQCVIVEDSVANIVPAKEMGMMAVLVDSNRHSSEADFVISRVHELVDVLEQISDQEGYHS